MKKFVLMIISAFSNVMRKNFLEYAKCIAIFLIVAGFFSCDRQGDDPPIEDDDPPTIFEPIDPNNARLAKIIRYSNSTASKITGEIVYTYDEAGNLNRESYFDEWNGTMLCIYFIEYKYHEQKKVKESYFNCNLNSFPEGPVRHIRTCDKTKIVHRFMPGRPL